ncbi:MAG: hypothetical protein ACI8PZ_006320 [Myxococcota bacterium]|jgi:hypothetical protein
MPFDKISLRQLFFMRLLTGAMFMALGVGLAWLGGSCAVDPAQCVTGAVSPADQMFWFASITFGALLLNAGMMLLELTTRPPFKVAINVPFVAANFQVSAAIGLVALGFAVHRIIGSGASAIELLCVGGFAMNLVFVVMTKLHWNFTENTGKALPKA